MRVKKHPQPARSGFLYTNRELYSKYAGFPAEKAEKKSVAKGGTTTSYQLPVTSYQLPATSQKIPVMTHDYYII